MRDAKISSYEVLYTFDRFPKFYPSHCQNVYSTAQDKTS